MNRFGVADLRAMKACEYQIILFGDTFGASAERSRANLVRASRTGLDLSWLAAKVLSPADHWTFTRDYALATDAYFAAYERARDTFAASEKTFSDDRAFHSALRAARSAQHEAIANALADALGLD